MKKLLVMILVIAIIVIGLPMGMGGMSECPMCTSPETHISLAICAAILLSLMVFSILFASLIAGDRNNLSGRLTRRSIFRPPRSA